MNFSDFRTYLYVILGEIPLIAVLVAATVAAFKRRQKAPKAFNLAILAFVLMLLSLLVGMTYSIFRLAEVIPLTRANVSTFGYIALTSGVIRLSLQTVAWSLIIIALFSLQQRIANNPNA